MTMMRASTCDVASRTSFDSSGDEDGRESVLWDQADGAAHRAAHRGNRSVGYLEGGGSWVRAHQRLLSPPSALIRLQPQHLS